MTTLSTALDVAGASQRLAATSRVRLPGLLQDGVGALYAAVTDPGMLWMRAIHNPWNSEVPVALFEGGDHRLSTPKDLDRLIAAVEAMRGSGRV